jgi:hyperosmotically inducible protein
MSYKKLVTLSVAIAALALAGCTPTRTQKSFGETVDDGTITAKVKTALIEDPTTEARDINVDTRRGVVQLNGFVASDPGRTQAARVARGVPGVTRVENNLTLQREVRTAGGVMDDATITTTVKANLAADPVTSALAIKVETHDGRVQLGGWVDSKAAKTQAGQVAAAVRGVTAVQNDLDIKK